MRAVTEVHELNALEDQYRESFSSRYHRPPLQLTNFGRTELKSIYHRLNDFDLCKEMIKYYLVINGIGGKDWFKHNGHSIKILKDNIDAVYADWCDAASEAKSNNYRYIVGFSESGHPIGSDKAVPLIKGITPIDHDKWKQQDEEKRFRVPRKRWENAGVDTRAWVEYWADLERKQDKTGKL